MLANFVFLNIFLICLLGFVTSYTDLKKGVIENRFVFPAIAIALALNYLNGFGFPGFLLNGFFAFLFGFLLWIAGLWSAGDSKLFLAFALLFPLSLYSSNAAFPAFTILVNSFVPAFLLLLALILFKTSGRQKLEALKQAFRPGILLSVAVFFFAFYWLLDMFFSFIQVQLDFFMVALLLFAIVSGVEFFLPKKSLYFFAAVALAFFFLKVDTVLTQDFLLFFLSFLLIAIFLLFFALRLGLSCFGKSVALSKLKPGMVLLETVVQRENKIGKKKPLLPSFVNIFAEIKEKTVVQSGPKGLSITDINLLKKAKAGKKLSFDRLLVQETVPFAPIIFFGTLLSFFTSLLFAF